MHDKFRVVKTLMFLIAIAFVIVVVFLWNKNRLVSELYKDYETTSYQLENKNLKLLVADTSEKKQKGLMFYRELLGVDGMIFTYEKDQLLTFWNGNTFMDLNVYWINDGEIIKKDYLPSIEKQGQVVISSETLVDTVIEVPIGK